jgi:hypothetical protein
MPPGGNIAAPLNTSNVGQSKQGGLTLNIGGATYGLIVDKGFVGIQTSTPQAELDVNGNILAHNLNLNQNLNVAGDGYFGGNLNVNGDIHARNFIVSNANSNTNVSIGPNGLCLNGVCKTSWEEVCATCGSSGGGDCSKEIGTQTNYAGGQVGVCNYYNWGGGCSGATATYHDYGSHCVGVCSCQNMAISWDPNYSFASQSAADCWSRCFSVTTVNDMRGNP